jgi:hypothetical protein
MMDDLLKALLGGTEPEEPPREASGEPQMDDLLKALLGGAEPEGPSRETSADPLMSLLGGVLGGGGSGQASSGGGLLDLLLGGGAQQQAAAPQASSQEPAGGLTDLLGALGGAGSGGGASTLLQPILSGLVERLGLSPQLAQVVVSFVLGKLLTRAASASTASAMPATGGASAGLDLSSLLGQMRSGEGVGTRSLGAPDISEELVQTTGMDHDLAAASIEEVLNMLGAQMGSTRGAAGK